MFLFIFIHLNLFSNVPVISSWFTVCFKTMLFNFHIFVNFQFFSLLLDLWFPFTEGTDHTMDYFNFLSFPKTFFAQHMVYSGEYSMYSAVVRWWILYTYVRSSWFFMLSPLFLYLSSVWLFYPLLKVEYWSIQLPL